MSDHLHNKFVELRVRLDTFLSRLDQRVDEVVAEAVPTARQMVRGDGLEHNPELEDFLGGIRSQVKAVSVRGVKTFEEKFGVFSDVDDDDTSQAYDLLEEKVDKWAERMIERTDRALSDLDGRGTQAQRLWDAGVADYQRQRENYRCTQCSAPVPLPPMDQCGQAVYLTCTGCSTQLTFMPSDAIQTACAYAHTLASERAADFERIYNDLADDSYGDLAQELVAQAQWQAAEQVHYERLLPSTAVKELARVNATLTGHEDTFGPQAEEAGSFQTETMYYRILVGLANTISVYRQQGRRREAELITAMIPGIARRGCQVAGAITSGTYNDQLGQSYLNKAQACPVHYDKWGQVWFLR